MAAALAVAACGGSSDVATNASASAGGDPSGSSNAGSKATLNLVGYSTPEKAYDAVDQAYAKTSGGAGIGFRTSFAASGAQSRAVAAGQPADVVAFSTSPDVDRLVQAGLVASNWAAGPTKGIVNDSTVVMIVRPGNPKHIIGWDDLIKPGVKVVTPNPATSGSARWNIMAAYGAELREGKSKSQALTYLATLLEKNTVAQPDSASDALQAFVSGQGDVLLDYESDAIAAKRAGDKIQIVYPKSSILIQTPIAVLKKSGRLSQANAYVKWLESPPAQKLWGQQGYRPVLPSVAKQFTSTFPHVNTFTIDSFGGWTKVNDEFFTAPNGSVIKIEEKAGVPTSSS
ncbi:MAG TPA: sulfate ABC transporter substrate-binding protein [Solirubrobacteraceae bacterium]|nr:sulfate ABC transporter substrate-binding protein [Solirubrobacteraceae bacterium]